MSRLRRVADIERRRREQAGAELSEARRELSRHHEELRRMMTPTAERQPTSGPSLLAHHQAAGRRVERLVDAAHAQREVVSAAEHEFAQTDRRARQMERAVELDDERRTAARRRTEEARLEDTMIAVSAGRRKSTQPDERGGGRR